MSIKNHIQVCKKDLQNSDGSIATKPIERLWKAKPKIVIKGVKKLPDDERRSIRILEQSCFVNELNKDEGNLKYYFQRHVCPSFCGSVPLSVRLSED